jgi:hypothetical protein
MPRNIQTRCLTRHFFDRFFDKDSISPGSDPTSGVIQTVSILAVPGLMLVFWMRFSPYFFISYSMIVMGFVMVFKWDSLFPDRRDYLILGSLPIRYRDLFFSKAKALLLFLSMFAVSANFFASLLSPVGRGKGPAWLNFIAHAAGVFGGALFMILGFAALQGILITVLPDRLFRRISPIIQMFSITILLTIFLIYPLIDAGIRPLASRSSELMDYFPIFWFLGLYTFLLPGGDPNPIYGALALKALYGLGSGSIVCFVTYAVAYKRHARSILEAEDALPRPHDVSRFSNGIGRAVLQHPVQRGCFRFIAAVLARSSKHQLFVAVYLAIGFSLGLTSLFTINPTAAFPFAISKNGMLALPLTLSFFVVSGLRATFNMPYQLPANWMFQVTDSGDAREHVAATRKWVAFWGLLPLALFAAALEFGYWPWKDAVLHLAFESVVSLILLQVLFFSFRKVPFTCSYYPGKKNLAILMGVYLYGFTTYSSTMVALESWLVVDVRRLFAFVVLALGLILILSSAGSRRRARLIWEEQSDAQLQSLGLN